MQDIKDRVNVSNFSDSVIEELISYYAVITNKYLRVKPRNPMQEKVKSSKLTWLSFSAESVTKVISIDTKQDVTETVTVDGRILYGLHPNQLYECEYVIEDYDDLQLLMRKCIIDMTCSAVERAKLQKKNMKTSESIGDYSYQISPEILDEPDTNQKILSVLKGFRAKNKPVMAT
ncbi:hypothetical protein BAMA111019_20340 [Bacillus manliponensis]